MPTVTKADLVSRVYNRLEDNSAFYTPEEVGRAVGQDAVRALNLLTGYVQSSVFVQAIIGKVIYPVPPSLLFVTEVRFNGRTLRQSSTRKMGLTRPRWMRETTETQRSRVETWMPVGIRSIAIHPADAKAIGNQIEMIGVAEPARLVDDGDVLSLPAESGDAVEILGAHIPMMKAGGLVSRAAMEMYKSFLPRMNELRRYQAKIAPRFFVEEERQR